MKTIVGLFDDFLQASSAAKQLEAAGILRDDISIVANNEGGRHVSVDTEGQTTANSGHAIGHDAVVGAEIGGAVGFLVGLTGLAIPGLGWIATAGWLVGTLLGAGTGAVIGGLVGALTHVGVPEEDAHYYQESVRRGGTLVAVRAQDEDAQRVADILGETGAVNIDERAAQFRQEGWTPSSASTITESATSVPASSASMASASVASASMASAPAMPAASMSVRGDAQAVIPVVEEELQVGKREVQSGGIRVYTHVTQTPVTEQVTLREEHVTVDRQPVNRPATSADLSTALTDQTVEVTGRREEAVIAKEARVVEEVFINKDATERTETIQDTVRRTDVDVQSIAGGAGATTTIDAPGNGVPGIQTGGTTADGHADSRGITEKAADAVTGDRTDDKTGRRV